MLLFVYNLNTMSSQEASTKTKQTKGKKSKSSKTEESTEQEVAQSEQEIVVPEQINADNSIIESDQENLNEEISFETSPDTEAENAEYIKQLSIIKEAYEKLNSMPFKNLTPTPEFFSNVMVFKKKINKEHAKLNESIADFSEKEVLVQIKKGYKSKKNKNKTTDKSKSSVNVPKDTYPEVCLFLGVPEGAQVSQTSVQRKICDIVKQYKIAGNPDITVEGDNRSFNIIGDLVPIFNYFRDKAIERGDLQNKDEFPKVSSFTSMMKYFKYCFHPKAK